METTTKMPNKSYFSISIPKRALYSALIFVGIVVFTYIQFIGFIIPGFGYIFLPRKNAAPLGEIALFWVPFIGYGLLSVGLCYFVRIFKFLKDNNETGLIKKLISGFRGGLIIGGLIFVILSLAIYSFSFSTNIDLILAFVRCINMGVTIGLAAGFVFGVSGIFFEFD